MCVVRVVDGARRAVGVRCSSTRRVFTLGGYFVLNITIILVSGLIAGVICKRFKASPLIGYLVVGALIGPGGFDLTGSGAIEKALKSDEAYLQKVQEERPVDADEHETATLDGIQERHNREESSGAFVALLTVEEENIERKPIRRRA